MSAVAEALDRAALTVDGRDYTVADVAAAAVYLGEWSGVQVRAAAGTAAIEAETPAAEEVSAAAEAFRRERRLLAAEEIEAWLARRALSAGEWMRWVRMDVARRTAVATQEAEPTPSALYTEALCSGALARTARWLAEVLVAPRPSSAPASSGRLPDPRRLGPLGIEFERARALLEELRWRRSALQDLADGQSGPEAIAAQVRAHQADWLSVSYRVLAVPGESAAREALLCVRDDGMSLEEVAALAGTEVAHEFDLLADVADGLQRHLLSATRGELIGPLERGEASAIVMVDDKIPPIPDDPEIVRRARRELLIRTLEREIAARVEWHDRL